MEQLKPGQLVRSLAGRDKGEHYLVLKDIDQRFVQLVNGATRPLGRPKRKNKIHVQRYQRRVNFAELIDAQKLTDSHIIRYLKELAPGEDVEQEA